MGFCCRWAFPTREMTVLSGTEATLSMVIPRVGNAHLQQNLISDSFSCTVPPKNYLSQLKKKMKRIYVVCLGKNTGVRTEFLSQAKTTDFLIWCARKPFLDCFASFFVGFLVQYCLKERYLIYLFIYLQIFVRAFAVHLSIRFNSMEFW